MLQEYLPYEDEESILEGFLACHDKLNKRPAVLLCHAWAGRDSFICEKARELAAWGYVAFALDMYGKGVLGRSAQENGALKQPFLDDREFLLRRVLLGYNLLASLPYVDADRICVLGYGFGGICALDLARSGVSLKGAISVYGHFQPPSNKSHETIKAPILILHGANDPIAPLSELALFAEEMKAVQANWEAHLFGNTVHAFATPTVQDPAKGICYNAVAAEKANQLIQSFLKENLKGGS